MDLLDKDKRIKPALDYLLLIFFCLIFVFAVVMWVKYFDSLDDSGVLPTPGAFNQVIKQPLRLKQRQTQWNADSVAQIEGWMTFDYINKQFNLPKNYLQGRLNIGSKFYPLVTIDRVSKEEKNHKVKFLDEVKQAVRDHFALNSPQ